MRVRDYYIKDYDWRVTVYYAVTRYYISSIVEHLKAIRCPDVVCNRVLSNMLSGDLNTGFTYSDNRWRKTIMLIGLSTSPAQFYNSLAHEQRHLVDDIAEEFHLNFTGERVAYLTGDIAMQTLPDVYDLLCPTCRCH